MGTQTIVLIVILLYMVATVVLGLYLSNRKKQKAAKQSNDDFLLASKSLGPFVLATTLFVANTGGASTIGVANNVRTQGLSAAWYVIAAGVGFFVVSFIAPYFRRSRSSTVPQIVGKRYGKACHVFTAFTSITALFMATGAQVIGTSSIISLLAGINFNTAAVITTVIVILYTMLGGYKSVVAANMLHIVSIIFGMLIALLVMVHNPVIGGFGALFAKANSMSATHPTGLNLLSMTAVGIPTIIGYIALYCFTFPTGQEIVQAYCSAKDGKSAKTGSIIAAFISAIFAIIPAMIGLIAVTFIDGFVTQGSGRNAMAEAAINFAPPVIAGIVLASLVAATMSSASGNMIGTATMFTNDVFRPYINKGKKDEGKEILVSRLTMVVIGAIALFVALVARNIISVMMAAFALRSAGPFAAFVCGLFYKNVTVRAGFLSILTGTVVAIIWIFVLVPAQVLGKFSGLAAMVPGGIVAFITIFVVSAIDKKLGVKPAPEIEFDT